VKRAVDLFGAGVGLALAAPLIGIAAVAIKLDDGGPVFYRQRRVGLHGVEFDLVKLRTMIPGAEAQGAGWAVDYADPRITRAGRVLRRLSLDELPQLWNVIHGEMSLVGPRPTLAYQVEQYTPRQRSAWLDLKIIARTPRVLFTGTYRGDTGGWRQQS
jgi:lipopolysaccharide/colanic/teichoic acid biosynthesis glycosyltransferase